jgi:hypothetical protein
MHRIVLFSLPLLFVTALPAPAGKDAGDYLTKDGQLKHALDILDVKGGFAGFTGTQLTVQPEGTWKSAAVALNQSKLVSEGKLTPKQLADLAKSLAKYDLLHLPDEGKVMVNPHLITLTFGKHTSEIRNVEKLPEPGDSVAGRYAGVVRAVRELCKGKAEEKK